MARVPPPSTVIKTPDERRALLLVSLAGRSQADRDKALADFDAEEAEAEAARRARQAIYDREQV